MGVPRGHQGRRVGSLNGAVRRVRAAVLKAQIRETGLTPGQTDVAGHGDGLSVARVVQAGQHLERTAGTRILQQEVQHPRDRVRAVLRRSAVPQDLDLTKRDRRNRGQVRPLSAVRNTDSRPQDHRPAMPPFAVHQNERVVRRQAAQVRRPHDRRRIAADRADVQRRHDVAQKLVEIRLSLMRHVLRGDHVDGHHRLRHRALPSPAAGDDDLLVDMCGRMLGLGLVVPIALVRVRRRLVLDLLGPQRTGHCEAYEEQRNRGEPNATAQGRTVTVHPAGTRSSSGHGTATNPRRGFRRTKPGCDPHLVQPAVLPEHPIHPGSPSTPGWPRS